MIFCLWQRAGEYECGDHTHVTSNGLEFFNCGPGTIILLLGLCHKPASWRMAGCSFYGPVRTLLSHYLEFFILFFYYLLFHLFQFIVAAGFPTQHCRRIIWNFFWLRIFEDLSYWAHESQCLFCSSLSTVELLVFEEGFLPSDDPELLKANHFLSVLEDTGCAQRRVTDLGLIFMKSNLLSAKYLQECFARRGVAMVFGNCSCA